MNYDQSIHSNPDAMAWAEFFVSSLREMAVARYQSGDDLDQLTREVAAELAADKMTMLTWFANAMMAMHDHLKSKEAE